MSLLGDRYQPEPGKPDPMTWYRCTVKGCDYKTKQRRGLPQVAHNCAVRKALVDLKEDA